MRMFKCTKGNSKKFWNIALKGDRFTVHFGRIGTDGQKQVKTFPSDEDAQKAHDKLVAEKLKKGYKETTPPPKPTPPPLSPLGQSLEAALVEDPDDLANHMAYADYLTEQGDPRGDLVRIQLPLEDESKPKAERDKLKKQERALLRANAEAWLGDLAPLVQTWNKSKQWGDLATQCTFARGWLDTLTVGRYTLEFVRLLAKAPQLRLLRHLTLYHNDFEHGEVLPEDGVPKGSDNPALYPLVGSPYLSNVKTFTVGERISQAEEDDFEDGGISCYTQGDGAVEIIKRMPKLEELYLLAHNIDTEQLFSLKTLNHLRVLMLYHAKSYPLARLAKNPSLGHLTHLLLHPHAIDDEEPYIREPGVKALVTSPHLKSLTHLQLRLSDMGDKGVRTIIQSGVLKRLQVLDLRHGRVSDEGARLLAACPDTKNLTRLDLTNNCLTDAGVRELRDARVKVVAKNQWRLTGDEEDDQEYLYAGDFE